MASYITGDLDLSFLGLPAHQYNKSKITSCGNFISSVIFHEHDLVNSWMFFNLWYMRYFVYNINILLHRKKMDFVIKDFCLVHGVFVVLFVINIFYASSKLHHFLYFIWHFIVLTHLKLMTDLYEDFVDVSLKFHNTNTVRLKC